jgi:hypothetical protein
MIFKREVRKIDIEPEYLICVRRYQILKFIIEWDSFGGKCT